MLKVCNFISAQVTHAEIAFIYTTFFRNLYFRKMENAFLPRAENAFSPKGINGISDWLGRNFFADRSAKQFLTRQIPPETIFPEKQSIKSAESAVYFVFPEILFPEASLK